MLVSCSMVIDCIDADIDVVVMMLYLLEVLFRADIMLPYRTIVLYLYHMQWTENDMFSFHQYIFGNKQNWACMMKKA